MELQEGWDQGSVNSGIRAVSGGIRAQLVVGSGLKFTKKNEDSNIRLRSKCFELRSSIHMGWDIGLFSN